MSRIRSIHPGLWTDEAFVSLSPMARLLLMGLWNECDDMGSFAWSPLTLKMRVLPADNADASELLGEMVGAGIIMRYELAGKAYGAVRNFCQFQRPKKPNSTCPQTDEVREWVNVIARETRTGSEEVPNQSGTPSGKVRQMEDGGGRVDSSVSDETVVTEPEIEDDELKPEHVVEAWNDMAKRTGLPVVRKLTPDRVKSLSRRIHENSIDEFTEAIRAIEQSEFLRGGGRNGWRADFDFLLSPTKFNKILEGTYGQ
jgi:hypothetical protein